MRYLRPLIILAFWVPSLAFGTTTRLGDYDRVPPAKPKVDSPQLRTSLGITGGHLNFDSSRHEGLGATLQAGYKSGALYLYGDYSLLSLSQDSDSTGLYHRLGANLRFNARDIRLGDIGLIGLWVEGGLGRSFVNLYHGEYVHRNDLAVGAGFNVDVKVGSKVLNLDYFIRGVASASNDSPVAMAQCGTCSLGDGTNLSILFGVSLGISNIL